MKSRILIQIMTSFIACMFIAACSDKENDDTLVDIQTDGVPVSVQLSSKALPNNMKCDLYIYNKKTDESIYKLNEIISFGNEDTKEAKFRKNDLNNNDYRLLFVATPSDYNDELTLSGVEIGKSWSDIKIVANNYKLSDNFYFQVLSTPGSQILADGRIDADLIRLVGQMTLDIYHLNTGGDPDNIDDSTVSSVLDRVKKINISYTGLTKELTFDADGKIVEGEPFSGTYSHDIETAYDSNTFNVTIEDQKQNVISIASNGMTGSARIKGFYCLPATKKIRVKATFEFIDTTPTCENNHTGTHTETCYPLNSITLNLPQESVSDNLLSIQADHFTVNKAGIWLNRIIDVLQESGFGFDIVWANQENNDNNG